MKIGIYSRRTAAQSPVFDFLRTVPVSNTPQPKRTKDKKMFLSLYKSLKANKKGNYKPEEIRHSFIVATVKQQSALVIEGLIPVPVQNRILKRKVCSLKKYTEKPMRVRVCSRRATPTLSKFEFDLNDFSK